MEALAEFGGVVARRRSLIRYAALLAVLWTMLSPVADIPCSQGP